MTKKICGWLAVCATVIKAFKPMPKIPFGTGYVIIQERHKPTPTKHIPYCGSVHFVGRETKLTIIHENLQRGDSVAVTGMGGVGKTELVTQYARRHQDSYGGIVWLNAKETNLADKVLMFFLREYVTEIPQQIEGIRLSIQEQIAFCWSQYPKANLPILVIFDDVSTLADLREVVPTDPRFRLLVTTRDHNLDPQFITSIPLDVLSPEKAVELLQNLLGEENRRVENEPEAAENICDLLGYLPLGIALVGGYLAQEPNLSLMDMLERLKQKKLTETSLQTRETINKEPFLGVQAAFELTWQKLFSKEEHELPPSFSNSQQLGMLLSLFAPRAIPLKLLDSVAIKTETQEGKRELNWTPETVKKAQNQLWKYNLLQLTEKPESCCQIHSLVRWFLQDKLANSGELRFLLQRTFVNAMLDLADYLPDIPTTEQIKSVRDIMPHLEELAGQIITVIEKNNKNKRDKEEYSSQNLISEIQNQTLVSSEKIAWIFTRLGKFYAGYGLYPQAEDWYKRCLTTCQTLFTKDHPDIAGGLNSLATLYQCEGRYEEAEPLYREALAICEKVLGKNHPNTNFIRTQLKVFQLLKFPPVRLVGMVLRIVFSPFVLLRKIWQWLVCCFYEIPEKK